MSSHDVGWHIGGTDLITRITYRRKVCRYIEYLCPAPSQQRTTCHPVSSLRMRRYAIKTLSTLMALCEGNPQQGMHGWSSDHYGWLLRMQLQMRHSFPPEQLWTFKVACDLKATRRHFDPAGWQTIDVEQNETLDIIALLISSHHKGNPICGHDINLIFIIIAQVNWNLTVISYRKLESGTKCRTFYRI